MAAIAQVPQLQVELLQDSKVVDFALVLQGIKQGLQVFSTNSADPWIPWPWP